MQFVYELVIRYHLSKHEQDILLYIAEHISEQPKLPIRDVAHATFTSSSTIFNLAKKMHFSGYSELLFFMKDKVVQENHMKQQVEQLSTVTIPTLVTEKQIEMFHHLLAENIKQNGEIYIVGLGFSNQTAQYIHDRFLLNHIKAVVTAHFQVIFHTEVPKLIIFISESGINQQLVKMMQSTVQHGQQSILFSSGIETPLSHDASLFIPVMKDETQRLHFTPMSMLTFDYLLDSYLSSPSIPQ